MSAVPPKGSRSGSGREPRDDQVINCRSRSQVGCRVPSPSFLFRFLENTRSPPEGGIGSLVRNDNQPIGPVL